MLRFLLLVPVLALFLFQTSPTYGAVTYRLSTRTPRVKSGGTDATVHITVTGSKGSHHTLMVGKTVEEKNKGRVTRSNRFEQGRCDIITFESNDLGVLKTLDVSHTNSGKKPGWFLQDVAVTVVSGAPSQRVVFPCNRWLAISADDGQIRRILEPENVLSHYIVRVHTGNRAKSGTDARVRMNLEGTTGELSSYQLDCVGDPFENSNVNTFHVYARSLGELKTLKIWQDGTNSGSGWFLDKVVIMLEGQPQKQWRFNFNRWLDGKRGRSATKTL